MIREFEPCERAKAGRQIDGHGEILRGSMLERIGPTHQKIARKARVCEGHRVFVLTVSIRRTAPDKSVCARTAPEARRWLEIIRNEGEDDRGDLRDQTTQICCVQKKAQSAGEEPSCVIKMRRARNSASAMD